MLTKERFKEDFDLVVSNKKDNKVTVDYAYKEYKDKLEPYLHTIGLWKNDKGMTLSDIRLLLNIGRNTWEILSQLPTVKEYTLKSGDFMETRMEMEFLEAKRENKDNAKFHEMGFKLFHSNYGDRKDINYNFPKNIELKITGAKMEDEEIDDFVKEEHLPEE